MIALQQPPKNASDRFNENLLAESNAKGETLYQQSRGSEIRAAFPRFIIVCLVFLVIAAIGLGIFTLIGGILSIIPIIGDMVGSLVQSMYCLVPLAAIATAGYFTYRNITKSSSVRKGEATPDTKLPWALGAREASRREDALIDSALAPFGEVNVHNKIWVLDFPGIQSVTINDDLFISSSAIDSKWLAPILLHEIGHLNNDDGRMLAAIRAFIASFVLYRMTTIGSLGRGTEGVAYSDTIAYVDALTAQIKMWGYGLVFGGISLIGRGPEWSQYFRERDFLADEYVVQLGLGSQLKEYLLETPQKTIAIPFSANWAQANELRIDRVLWLMGK